MIYASMAVVFVLGYAAIALEHPLKIDKAAAALFTAVVCWVLFITDSSTILQVSIEEARHVVEGSLLHHLGEIGGILFFLLGAMTIVELIDAHNGFALITDRIRTEKKSTLLFFLAFLAFFMSAALDNLTTSIVMATLLRKLIAKKEDLWLFAGVIIIAANAGGAWSTIGDVTTIMLWIGGQVTAGNIVIKLLVPSLVCLFVPLWLAMRKLEGEVEPLDEMESLHGVLEVPVREQKLILYVGIASLLFVPLFKSITHLPPFLGILLGLSILWALTDLLHLNKANQDRKALSIGKIIERVDTPSILFFLGILLAVGALQSAGHLGQVATFLDEKVGNIWIINIVIGLLSSIVDNVPLVAGAMGMYEISTYPSDHLFWELLAYCAGTGGSVLIIGSAAGVAIMGILKIDFIWYLKHIAFLALVGYLSGALTFYLLTISIG